MASTIPLKEVLKRAFPGLKEHLAEEMISSSKVCSYPPGTTLCHEGWIESIFYILIDGDVEVTKTINDEEERLLKHLGPGDFFGEMAILHNAPRAATIKTVAETSVLEITKEVFSALLERSSSISLAVVREVSRRLRENDEMAIEDLRLKAKELAQAYEQLAEMEFARHEFLTTIAHELRTPLTAANGFLQIIHTGMLQGDALKSALDTVTRNLQEITSLTNDILFLQEMDLILPDFQQVDIATILSVVVEQLRGKADQNNVSITLKISPALPSIGGDAKSLERAFAAILDNAIKFSPDGGSVVVEVAPCNGRIRATIQDEGVGIPPEAIGRVFERFYHLDQVGSHLFRGVGLGLSVTLQVIQQHHGAIAVKSELGQGTTIIVDIG